MSNKISGKSTRRLLTASMSLVLMISLSSCSGANNGVSDEKIYASVGSGDKKVSVTNKDLWSEFMWNSNTVLESQIKNVVVNNQIEKIKTALSKSYDNLTDEDKTLLNVEDEKGFNSLVEYYKNRLVDYVVQDIYNLTFSPNNYWDDVETLTENTEKKLRLKYIDELYVNYQVTGIEELIENRGRDNFDNYYSLAKKLSDIYVPALAKEVAAKESYIDEVATALEEDDDPEDSKYGYFSKTEYVNKFKTEFINQFDLSAIVIRFNSNDEYNDTLRAFGLKIVDKNYYFLDNSSLKLNADASYDSYIKAYNEISDDEVKNRGYNISTRMPNMLLDIYVQMYNYVYGGFRTKLASQEQFNFNFEDLNELRSEIGSVIDYYQSLSVAEANTFYETSKKLLLDNNSDIVKKTREQLDDIGSTLTSFLYDTVKVNKASTSTQNCNNGYYSAFKLAEYNEDDQFKDVYESTMSTDEIFENIILKKDDEGQYTYKDENGLSVYEHVENILITNLLTSSSIDSKLSELTDDAIVKIYNEACEISYKLDHSDYSKAKGSVGDNVLATIEYDGKTWFLNVEANPEDENSITYVSYNEETNVFESQPFGTFEYFEKQNGATTAIDLISKKIIKTTKAYEKTNEDRDDYKKYIKYLLYSFANNSYSSNGYPASIGKYDFLMLYFHSANIDTIIDDFYRIQYASSQLLTDYTSDQLNDLFKTYSDKIYDNYFSMGGTRLVVYYDENEDEDADDVIDWKNKTVSFEGNTVTLEEVSKQLVMQVYQEVIADTGSHTDKLSALVTEIEGSARAEYNKNPIAVENKWAKYRKLGLRVKTEEFSVTNSSDTVDLSLKNKIYSYYTDESYNYFFNSTSPSQYIEKLSTDKILETKDGYNLLVITSGDAKPSAKWTSKDNQNSVLENVYLKYNDKVIKVVDNVYNDEDQLNENQIKLYVMEYITNNSSNLSPTDISDALSTFISPVLSRFTSTETQRIILLNFLKQKTGSTASIENILEFGEEFAKPENYLGKIVSINQSIADDYVSDVYADDEHIDNYEDWWKNISDLVDSILIKEAQENE